MLKIAAISDLHVLPDNGDIDLLSCIKRRVEDISPDVFVIAGDISDQIELLSKSLAQLHVADCVNLFVAGNHDIWFEDGKPPTSLEKYSNHIKEICDKNGFIHLPDHQFICDDIAFIGSIGWYDYSFRRTELKIPIENYEQKEYRGAVWYDVFKIDWRFSDIEATNLFNQKLEYDLSTLPRNITKVVYVSHHLPFRQLTVYKDRLPWDFHSAFMGAQSTGQILEKDGRVVLSISGHSHVRNKIQIGNITAMTVPLGYGRPDEDNLDSLVKDAVAVIELTSKSVDINDFVEGDLCENLPFIQSRR